MKYSVTLKHAFSFLLVLILSQNVNAQLPDSVAITTNGSWIILYSEATNVYNPQTGTYNYETTTANYYYYRSGADTIIGGLTYTQLLGLYIIPNGDGSYSNSPFYPENYILAYRNDMNRRAYKIDSGSTTEDLWYDFNPGLGDTLWNPVAAVTTPYFVVNGIDSIDFCGTMYEQFSYDADNYPPYPSIQRVGRQHNFFHTYESPFRADFIISFCEESVPFATIASVDEASNDGHFHLFPNPAEDVITISSSVHSSSDIEIRVYNLTGQQMSGVHSSQSNGGENAQQLNISSLPKGLYYVHILKDSGDLEVLKFNKQ